MRITKDQIKKYGPYVVGALVLLFVLTSFFSSP